MLEQITLTVDGEQREVNAGTTGAELYFDDRDVVVMHVDGVLRDLSRPLEAGTAVERVTIDSPAGLEVLRHSTAHVMAQAVQQLRPDAKLGIGPYITDGFYFDFDVAEPFTPEDLKTLEKMMLKIVNQNQKFARRVVTEDEARKAMANEPYKLELLNKANEADAAGEGVNVEVGAGEHHHLRERRPQVRRHRVVRPVPRPAPAEHQADLQRLRADPHLGGLLAGQPEQPAAAAHLRHRLADQGSAEGLPGAHRRGRAPRPPQARRRA